MAEKDDDSDCSDEQEEEDGVGPWRIYDPRTWTSRGVIAFCAVCWAIIILNTMITMILLVGDNGGTCTGNYSKYEYLLCKDE